MCSSFCEVDDLTSVRWYPSPCFSSTSIATKVSSAMNVASNTAGAPASSAACVAARRSARALCGRSMSTPPGYRARAASPTWRPWSNRSCNTLSGCSSGASGSCTSHHSFLWHWRPEVKRDLERRAAVVLMARRVAPWCDSGPGYEVVPADSGQLAEHASEQGGQVQACSDCRERLPDQLLAHHLGPLIGWAPPLDEPRVQVHNPVLGDAGALVDSALGAAVAGGGAWRDELDREHRHADLAPFLEDFARLFL